MNFRVEELMASNDILDSGYTYLSGSHINEIRILLEEWDESSTVAENFLRFETENLFGKETEGTNTKFLYRLRKRFFSKEIDQLHTLRLTIHYILDKKLIDLLIHFHLGLIDPLYNIFVTNYLFSCYQKGEDFVTTKKVTPFLESLSNNQPDQSQRSPGVIQKIARGLLSTSRDFGILEGRIKRRFNSIFLPKEGLAYVLYRLKEETQTVKELIEHMGWKLFLLDETKVEELLFQAHDLKLIQYHQVGSIRRIDWLYPGIQEVLAFVTEKDFS